MDRDVPARRSRSPWPRRAATGLALAAAIGAGAATTAAAADAVAPDRFRSPSAADRPKIRWWWPDPVGVSDAELRREVSAIARAGFGGAELAWLQRAEGWGTPAWRAHVKAALTEARRRGIKLDLTLGPSWPISSPTMSEQLSQQELLFGTAQLDGPATFAGRPPAPPNVAGNMTLVAATAARVDGSAGAGARTTQLDPASAIDLTPQVRPDATLSWQAPPGRWVVFGFWQRATGQTTPLTFPWPTSEQRHEQPPGSGPNRWLIADHFRRASVDEALGFYADSLRPDGVGELLRRNGGDVFEDSLELLADLLWTPDMPAQFARRRGYALARYLPALLVPGGSFAASDPHAEQAPLFDFAGGAGARVRRDFDQTLTDLYVDEHLAPLAGWARRQGLELRSQVAYNTNLDVTRSARATPVPETETFGFGAPKPHGSDQARYALDGYRAMAAGAHQAGAREVSTELGDAFGAVYAQDPEDYKRLIDESYVGGVTQVVVHGFAYRDAPGATWPSWNPFGFAGISEAWTTEHPQWRDWPALTGYMSRAKVVLEAGRPSLDVAVYHDGGLEPTSRDVPLFRDRGLERAGYTHEYVDPDALALPAAAKVRGRLFGDGPAYRALVIDGEQALPQAAAEAIDRLAAGGVRVVVVGAPPQRGTSLKDPAAEDGAVRAAMARLLKRPTAARVASEAAVPGALRRLGVAPSARFRGARGAAELQTVHRRAGAVDYWFVRNPLARELRVTGTFATRGAPSALDLWNGTTSAVGAYRASRRGVEVPLTLPAGGTTVLAFRGRAGARPHVAATDAQTVAVERGALVVRDARGGTRRVRLGDGATRRVRLGAVPRPLRLERWQLRVTEALPKGTARHRLTLDRLRDWRAIPRLRDASGVGRYRATVAVPRAWLSQGRGVSLDVGAARGALRVSVNGRRVTRQSTPGGSWPVGALLRPGRNVVEVELATTLRNRVVALGKREPAFAVYRRLPTTPVGLLGPVRLVPYAQATVAQTRAR